MHSERMCCAAATMGCCAEMHKNPVTVGVLPSPCLSVQLLDRQTGVYCACSQLCRSFWPLHIFLRPAFCERIWRIVLFAVLFCPLASYEALTLRLEMCIFFFCGARMIASLQSAQFDFSGQQNITQHFKDKYCIDTWIHKGGSAVHRLCQW